MSRDDVALICPRCLVRGARVDLKAGAPLDGRSCNRCGGVLVPASGSERLLHEELAVDRAQLVDLADNFGGRRAPCASCGARVRPLLLRGVDVDVCFHCGALWFEHGALTRLSAGRHVEPALAPAARQELVATGTLRPLETVRLDARPAGRKFVGAVVRATGVASLLGAWVGVTHTAVVGVVLVGVGTLLRRRKIIDVFPRAGRLLRSGAWMPTDALDPRAERFDDGAVVVRRFGPFSQAHFVDGIGRVLAPLARGTAARVGRVAARTARRIGVDVVDDNERSSSRRQAPPPFSRVVDSFELRRDEQADRITFSATHDGARLFTIANAVPARGDEEGTSRRALCFFLEDGDGRRLRLHDDERGHTVVVDDASEAVAVLERATGVASSSCTLSGTAVRLWLTPRVLAVQLLLDDAGRLVGTVTRSDDGLRVTLTAKARASARFCAIVLAAHELVDDGRA